MNIIFGKKNKKKDIIIVSILTLVILQLFLLFPTMVSAAQPFNVAIELPANYQTVKPGDQIFFTIKLINLANSQRIDVTLNYDILDSNGKSVVHNTKTVAIETQASFVADLKVPDNASPGEYSVSVVVGSSLGESTAKTSLSVSTLQNELTFYIVGGIVLLVILIFIFIKFKPLIKKIQLKIRIGKIVREKLKKSVKK